MNLANNNKLKLNRMKKLTFLKLALITALTCVIVTSCGKDDGDVTPPGQTEIEKETGMRLAGVGDYRFNYDNNGRCVGMDCLEGPGSSHISIDWDKSEIRTSEGYEHPLDSIPIKFKTNGRGYVTELFTSWDYELNGNSYKGREEATLTYDKEGHLTNATFKTYDISGGKEEKDENLTEHGDYTLTWDKGNLVNAKYIEDYIEDNEHEKSEYNYEISYDRDRNSENAYKQWTEGAGYVFDHDIFILCHVGLFGVGTADFPIKITDEIGDHSINISTLSSGLISSEKFNGETYNYSYDEVGTRSNSLDSSLPTKAKKRPLRHHRKMWK